MHIDKYRGSLLGLAAADALGTTVEFSPPGSFTPLNSMSGGGPFRLEIGEWTDDTSMALCLAASLLESNGFNPRDQIERYIRWMQEGYLSSNGRCFDIGNTVKAALLRYLQTNDPYAGSTNDASAGNGSIMRLTPTALYYAEDPINAITLCGESSRTTHGAITCIDACRYLGGLIVGALHAESKEKLLSTRYAPIAGYWEGQPLCPEIDEIACGSFKRKQPPAIKGSGYVVHSLEAALWAFFSSESFEDGALKAVNLGDDADTTGAVYGQIAGAFYGSSNIPATWIDALALRTTIISFADALFSNRFKRTVNAEDL